MQEMEIKTGISSHKWVPTVDSIRIIQTEQEAAKEIKKSRIRRRQDQNDTLDILTESLSHYKTGIDDSM